MSDTPSLEIAEQVNCRIGPEDHFERCGVNLKWFEEPKYQSWIVTWKVKPEYTVKYENSRDRVGEYFNQQLQIGTLSYAKW